MENKDNILVWVNSDKTQAYVNFTTFLKNKLNLSLTALYTKNTNVHISNNDKEDINDYIIHRKQESTTSLRNKIKKLNPIFILIYINHNSVKKSKKIINILFVIKKLGIPFLVVPEDCSIAHLKHFITTLEYSIRSKERITWINYFSKKLASQIEIIYPTEKDEDISTDITNNLYFAEKLFNQSKNKHNFIKTSKRSEELIKESIKLADIRKNATIVFSTSTLNFLPQLFKPFEVKMIYKWRKNPLLFIPPKEDLLIPCH